MQTEVKGCFQMIDDEVKPDQAWENTLAPTRKHRVSNLKMRELSLLDFCTE